MQTLFAILHILGAVLTTILLGVGLNMVISGIQERRTKLGIAEIALSLGIPVTELEDPTNFQRLAAYSYSKFNSELFRNRISDFIGQILKAWSWFGISLQIILLILVIYGTVTSSLSSAPYAWLIVLLELLFPAIGLVVGLLSRILTGRDPGQASRARDFLSKAAENKSFADVG
jgi:hypothetical protein